jgi:hypothetical protein
VMRQLAVPGACFQPLALTLVRDGL